MDLLTSASLIGVFVIAGIVKGVSGMGLPTVAVSLLGLMMPPAQAAALLVWPTLVTNAAQCRGRYTRALFRRLWPLWAAMAAALVFVPLPAAVGSGDGARRALGAVLVVYGLFGLWRPALPRIVSLRRGPALAAGALTGWVTSATAVFVMPMVPYLQALRLPREAMVQALGLSFMIGTLALALKLQAGAVDLHPSLATAATIAAACAGLAVGTRWRRAFSPATFQRALFAVFVLLGGANLWRGF